MTEIQTYNPHLAMNCIVSNDKTNTERKYLHSTKINDPYLTIFQNNQRKKRITFSQQYFTPSLTIQRHKKRAYIDLTGRFPHKSSRGNSYIFLMYDYETNSILIEPLKN